MKATTVPRKTRQLVIERDQGRCLRCARLIGWIGYSLQHRNARRMGGAAAPHGLANLATLCGSATTPNGCHEAVERQRRIATADGWLISQFDQRVPAEIPLRTYFGWAFLTDDGRIVETTKPASEGVSA